jgi:hypothetical protein
MEIKDSSFYSISEVQSIVNWNRRKLQRYAKNNLLQIIDRRYIFKGSDVKKLIILSDNLATKKKLKDEGYVPVARVPKDILNLILDIDNDVYIMAMLIAIKEDKTLEVFSKEEYQQLQKQLTESTTLALRIAEYKEEIIRMEDYVKDYRLNIEYFKKSLDKRAKETEMILKSISERNFIEAKDKGLDKDPLN